MENRESSIPIADFDMRKPDFKQDQERVLSAIRVLPIESPEFDEFRGIYNENKDFYGLKVFAPDENSPGTKIYFRQSKNGIMLIQKVWGSIFLQEPPRFEDIKVVDKKTGIFFNVMDLSSIEGIKGKTVVSFCKKRKTSTDFIIGENCEGRRRGEILWNQYKFGSFKSTQESRIFSHLLDLFHEFGHRYQTDLFRKIKGVSSSSLLNKVAFNENNKINQSDSIRLKQLVKERERNAWAFALSLVMRLRHLGVDIMRGLTSEEIISYVDRCLSTYDEGLEGVPGNEISNRERRKAKRQVSFPAELAQQKILR